MDSAIKSGYRLGIEHFYGYVFSKRVNQAMKTDTELLNNLRSLDFWGAIGKLHHKGLIATEVVLAIATAACAVGLAGRNQKSTELPSRGQPTIGLITEASAGSDLLLNQQLAGVKTLSGRADCLPQLVAVDGGNLGAETVGLCQVNTRDGQGTEVIVRKQKGGDQQTIKQMLTARTSPETLYFEYGSGDQKETLFKYDVASGGTEWVLPDGKTIEFKKGQSPFEEMIGKILDPGNVAQAAEATQVYDPTKPATVTATPDGKLTITQPAPTETPTSTATESLPTPKPTSRPIEVIPPTPIPPTATPPEAPVPIKEYDGTVRPDFIPVGAYYIGGEHWAIDLLSKDCRVDGDPRFTLDPQFVYGDTSPATDTLRAGTYYSCTFNAKGLTMIVIWTVK